MVQIAKMHFSIALPFLALLASFANAAPPFIGRRNNGSYPTSSGATQTAEATTKTVTANCATATASPSSGTSYVLVLTNGTLSGLTPDDSGDNVTTTTSSDNSFVISLLSLEPQASAQSDNSNLTTSSGSYLIPTTSDALFVRNEYGSITVNKVAIVNSTSVVPSSTSPTAPTATAGIFDDLGNLFDDIVNAAEDLVETVIETAPLGSLAIPIIVIQGVDSALEIIGDVVQIVDDVVEIIEEGIDELLDNLPSVIPVPIVPAPSSSAAGPEPTHTSKPGKGKASSVWSLKPLRGDSAIVVVCGDGKANGGREHQ